MNKTCTILLLEGPQVVRVSFTRLQLVLVYNQDDMRGTVLLGYDLRHLRTAVEMLHDLLELRLPVGR